MKKKILIKCTSSCGTAMVSNAEAHTLMSFSNTLIKSFDKFKNVTFIDVKKYINDESIEIYKRNFQPLNTTPEKFVWLWYLRIFVMKLFLEENNFCNIFNNQRHCNKNSCY